MELSGELNVKDRFMKKSAKIILVCSLILNVFTISGFIVFKYYIRHTMFQSAAMIAESETRLQENILADIESNDPNKITELKTRLRKYIEQSRKSAAIWNEAANRN